MSEWTRNDYLKALNELIRDVNPRYDAPGRWATFLRSDVQAQIDLIMKTMTGMRALYNPAQLEAYNLLQGGLEVLRTRLMSEDFGIGEKLAAKIEELSA